MSTKTSTQRHGQTEVGIVEHNGQAFAAMGASVDGENITAYHGKGYTLTDWSGRVILDCRCSGVRKGTFRTHDGDTAEALVFRLTNGRAIVGVSLGEEMLFRGELVTDPDEFDREALRVAEHWLQVDAEDAERFQAELDAEADGSDDE